MARQKVRLHQAHAKPTCWIAVLSLGFALLALGGCATRSDFTALSSKNVNLSNIKIDRQKNLGRATGEDCTHIIIIIPTGGPASIEEAIDEALESKRGNLLLDAVANWSTFYIPYIYGRTCWKVEGDVYETY